LLDVYCDTIKLQDGHPTSSIILISPTRHLKAARITFDREYRFKWDGWELSERSPHVESARVNIENKAWTRFTITRHAKRWDICCYSTFAAPPLYIETWLAQAERIMSQIRLSCPGCEHDMRLVTRVECYIYFQNCFDLLSPIQPPENVFLFVQDLQDIDDAFEIAWFFATDSKGLERLSQADMLALGLQELRSQIFIPETWEVEPPVWNHCVSFTRFLGLLLTQSISRTSWVFPSLLLNGMGIIKDL